ncbi:uncharacterized protein B0I36DRAFT_378826 [Microdochium trichocladiopsis]|uniref:Copper acquisition factor BIM1-like domain-containing protein n=1 Tax=Microdochium trichocladiopsis TaxID=1682393 RepID=A0A9P8YGP9_9PEZI|nr:uncharacterized protein B0I36DRAFT_378826 [Microdochium trichocladiopsis]KAH7039682.1 hypothetical protein B0I36DRAFT_378826 [Microdochium trichocladiopsis]
MHKIGVLKALGAAVLTFVPAAAQHQDIDQNGDGEADGMGPAAFMWPPDRVWLDFTDNTGPCGSPDGPGNRTAFPLVDGAVSLVQQDEAFGVQISISYSNDPKSESDFQVLISPDAVKELNPGHQCLNITDPPSNVVAGSNATIQVKYVSDWDKNINETYYACADITYVAADKFNFASIPCFNVSVPAAPEPSSTAPGTSNASGTNSPAQGGSDSPAGLSGGAIAGIVVGVVVGVAALGILLFFLYRRDQRQKRVVDHVTSARNNVKWDAENRSTGESANSVPLETLSK